MPPHLVVRTIFSLDVIYLSYAWSCNYHEIITRRLLNNKLDDSFHDNVGFVYEIYLICISIRIMVLFYF